MDDEGIGIAGWLFADLMLVLALVFVVVGRGDADDAKADLAKETAAHKETQAALDEARAAAAETLDALTGERAAHAETQDALDEAHATVAETQGKLHEERAAVTEAQGQLKEEREAHKKTRECLSGLNPDFSFDQIVLRDVTRQRVTKEQILDGFVREDIGKSQEGIKWTPSDSSRQGLLPFLWKRQREGSRIALVETYSRDKLGAHVSLSREVNGVLFATLASTFPFRTPIFTNLESVQNDHTGAYLWEYPFEPGEVRINLFFVQPPGEDCKQP